MFEQEVQLEEKSSNVVPLLLILTLVAAIVGSAAYFYMDSRQTLGADQASVLVAAVLKAEAPATLHFHTGVVKSSVDEKPRDPHYRLLEKAGYVKLAPSKKDPSVQVTLTPLAQRALQSIPDVVTQKEKDGATSYLVPLATRKLVHVSSVAMKGSKLAEVHYTWIWVPTELGDLFDASGAQFGKMNTWDRALLIQKYGADFYHGQPREAVLSFARTGKNWRIVTE